MGPGAWGSPLCTPSRPSLLGRGHNGQRIKYSHLVKTLSVTRSLHIYLGG